jgi:uncharacterized membrane protein YfcA
MSANEIITLILIGLTAGIISGMLGVGGAIIMVPALVFFMGLNQHQAQGTSLSVLVFPVGFLAFWNYYKHGYVNFKLALVIMFAFVIGGYVGSHFAIRIPERPLKIIFGLLIIAMGLRMVIKK